MIVSCFFEEIFKLKNLLRKGWQVTDCWREVGRAESDAEHIFSCAILALYIMEKENLKLDHEKVLKLLLVHELCEIDAGDHTPLDDINSDEKFRLEYAGIQRLADDYGMDWMEELWLEFEEKKTPEAVFAKMIDKLECIMQSKIYSKTSNNPALYDEFYERSKSVVEGYEKFIDEIKWEK